MLQTLLDRGRLRADETFPCPGELRLAGRSFACSHPAMGTPLTVRTAIAYSCNCFAAHVALRFGTGELTRELNAWGVDARTADVKQQSDLAAARGAAAQNAKAVAVIDPATNRSILVDAKTAKAQQMTPAGEGAKLEAKAAQLQDMQVGSQNARTAIDGLRTKINPATLVQIQAALKSGDEGYIENIKRNLFNQNLSPDVNQYITAVLNLQERALSLRSLGGQGQGSEAQRNAIVRLLPTVADLSNKQLMKSKLDAFDQQVGIYYKNLPKVNVKGTAASPAGQQEAPKTGTIFGVQKSTGKRVQSNDGGKTWQLAQQ